MRILWIAILLASGLANTQSTVPHDGPTPVLMYMVDAWEDMRELPFIMIYDNLDVIYRVDVDRFRITKITETQLKGIELICKSLLMEEDLKGMYLSGNNSFSTPSNYIYYKDPSIEKPIAIIVQDRLDEPTTDIPRALTVLAFNSYNLNASFNSPSGQKASKEWLPAFIGIMLAKPPKSATSPAQWPNELPSIDEENTIKTDNGTLWLPVSYDALEENEDLQKAVSKLYESSPLLIEHNGVQYTCAFAVLYPGSHLWTSEFQRIQHDFYAEKQSNQEQ